MSSVPVKKLAIQKVGIEPTSSPPQTVPSTADLLLVTPLFSSVYKHYTHNGRNCQAHPNDKESYRTIQYSFYNMKNHTPLQFLYS